MRTNVAAIMTLPEPERWTFRSWLIRWTEYTGRVITPQGQQRRLDAIRAQHEQAAPRIRKR